jgi:GT2 family glycosyltransferase
MVSSTVTDITVIIVNWNTREMLKNCLESVMLHSREHVKIIVVDNASMDGSRDMVETLFPEVRLINSGGNIGFGRANNLAVPYADTPLILFLNPDTLVMKGTLERIIDFMESHPNVGALSCKAIYGPGQKENIGIDRGAHTLGLQWFPTPFTELLQLLFLSDKMIQKFKNYLPYKDPNESGYVTKLFGGCLLVRRKVLDAIGYFDERFFMYGEDTDLCRRINESGWKLYYLSEAVIVHAAGGASKKTSANFSTLMKCESHLKLMEKYYGKGRGIAYRSVILGGSFFRLAVLLLLNGLSMIKIFRSPKNLNRSLSKYVAMAKWALCLKNPHVKQ